MWRIGSNSGFQVRIGGCRAPAETGCTGDHAALVEGACRMTFCQQIVEKFSAVLGRERELKLKVSSYMLVPLGNKYIRVSWRFMRIYGDPWRYMDIHGDSLDIHRDPWPSMEIHGDRWRGIEIYEIHVEIHRDPWTFMGIRGYSWKSIEFHGGPWISMEVHGELCTFVYIHRTLWNPWRSVELHWDS